MRVQTLIATTSDTALFRIGGQYPDLRLSDLPKKLSQDVGLHPSLHHLKVYDLAQAPAAFPIAYADWQNSIAQVEEAEIALKSITKPAVLQPKGSGLFDGLKAQVDASADEEQYQQILVDAQARVKALKDTIQAKKEVAIALKSD